MIKKPSRKPSAVSASSQKKKGKTGRISRSARKPTSTQGKRVAVRKESGIFPDRGRNIPFIREHHAEGAITYYGRVCDDEDSETSILIKRELADGSVKWSIMADGENMRHGDADRLQLQGMDRNEEAKRLWWAVQQVKLSPSVIDDGFDGITIFAAIACSINDWPNIRNAVAKAIETGNPHHLKQFQKKGQFRLLEKIIEAIHASQLKATKRWEMALAVKNAAQKCGRIPSVTEVQQSLSMLRGTALDGTEFRDDVRAAGFHWLIASRRKKLS